MSIYKRGETWWLRFVWEGRVIRLSMGRESKRITEQLEGA